jgi:cullin 3
MTNPEPRQQGLTKDENVDFDATWHVLETALQEIHTKNASKLSFEELYRNAYKIVLKKKGDVLYERVSLLEELWLRDTIRVKINQFVTSSIILGAAGETFAGQSTERRIAGERFMRELKDAFSDHQLCMGMITDVLMYMVRLCPSPLSKFSVVIVHLFFKQPY